MLHKSHLLDGHLMMKITHAAVVQIDSRGQVLLIAKLRKPVISITVVHVVASSVIHALKIEFRFHQLVVLFQFAFVIDVIII